MSMVINILLWFTSILFALFGIIGGPWIIGLGINEIIQRAKGCTLYSYIVGIVNIIGGFFVIVGMAGCTIIANPYLHALIQ